MVGWGSHNKVCGKRDLSDFCRHDDASFTLVLALMAGQCTSHLCFTVSVETDLVEKEGGLTGRTGPNLRFKKTIQVVIIT